MELIEILTDLQAVLLVFLLLQLKHFVADFVFQTNRMVIEKGIYGSRYGVYHSLIQGAGTFLAFAWIHPLLGVTTGLADFVLHYHIDWLKVNLNNRYNLTVNDSEFWMLLGADQLAHQLTYIAIIGWVFFAF